MFWYLMQCVGVVWGATFWRDIEYFVSRDMTALIFYVFFISIFVALGLVLASRSIASSLLYTKGEWYLAGSYQCGYRSFPAARLEFGLFI